VKASVTFEQGNGREAQIASDEVPSHFARLLIMKAIFLPPTHFRRLGNPNHVEVWPPVRVQLQHAAKLTHSTHYTRHDSSLSPQSLPPSATAPAPEGRCAIRLRQPAR
jgi:hypothetical protein